MFAAKAAPTLNRITMVAFRRIYFCVTVVSVFVMQAMGKGQQRTQSVRLSRDYYTLGKPINNGYNIANNPANSAEHV